MGLATLAVFAGGIETAGAAGAAGSTGAAGAAGARLGPRRSSAKARACCSIGTSPRKNDEWRRLYSRTGLPVLDAFRRRGHTTGMKAFISYAAADREWARQFHQQLEASGVEAWLDVHELFPGDNWQRQMGDALESSDV